MSGDASIEHTRSDRPIVIKLGGAALEPEQSNAELWRDLTMCASRTPTVVVHGGGSAVDRMLARLGMHSERRDGLRVTPTEHIDVVAAVLAGQVSSTLVAALRRAGAHPVGMTLTSADFSAVLAHGGSLGLVGMVDPNATGEATTTTALLAAGRLPVINSIGHTADGTPLNVNADDAAAGVAQRLNAQRLVLLTDVRAVLDADGAAIASLPADRIEPMIEAGTIAGGMAAKCRAAAHAAKLSGTPVTIAGFAEPGVLASIERGGTVGTTIFASDQPSATKSATSAATPTAAGETA